MEVSNIIAIIITIFNLILLIFLIARFKWNKYEEAIVRRLKKEVTMLIKELNRVTERNITLVEDSIQKKEKQRIKDKSNNKKQTNNKSKNQTKVMVNVEKSNNNVAVKRKSNVEQSAENNKDYSPFYQKTSYNTYNLLSKKMMSKKNVNTNSNNDLL